MRERIHPLALLGGILFLALAGILSLACLSWGT